ncbi:MerR family transcriptional regulator [Brevibacillus choshinensis]|uniref:MerR family transcriptional regulator n=1 Tax=Brevibacillus choshinensis TaxID=54911 RepID=A0ABX7FV29_BRECH|nr:MerR family transcriptional regulator [Brevibacillus choshinensis]QRG70052.1 MerR family transcriptional regulator [Brevibacillus choshinensis]
MKKNGRLHYFTAGEFAKLCNVNKQTLFYYDKIGLFSPEIVADSGYRFYSYEQLEVFTGISVLKEMDMPLNDIKTFLENRNPQNLLELLETKQKEAQIKIERLSYLKKYLATKSEIVLESMNASEDSVLYVTLPEEYYIFSEYLGNPEIGEITTAFIEHLNYCHSFGIFSPYPVSGIVKTDNIPGPEVYGYARIYTRIFNKIDIPHIAIKPAGTYAVIYHKGGFRSAYKSYQQLVADVRCKGYNLGDFFYEDTMLDELAMRGYNNYTLKISVQCINKN